MSESSLHSQHLPFPRRQQFRCDREQLLDNLRRSVRRDESGHRATTLYTGGAPAEPVDQASAVSPLWYSCPFGLVLDRHFFALHEGVTVLGRAERCDIVLRPMYISRIHCAILVRADHVCELHDLASHNGTRLNGSVIDQPRELTSGDRITLCDRTFRFHACAGSHGSETRDGV